MEVITSRLYSTLADCTLLAVTVLGFKPQSFVGTNVLSYLKFAVIAFLRLIISSYSASRPPLPQMTFEPSQEPTAQLLPNDKHALQYCGADNVLELQGVVNV